MPVVDKSTGSDEVDAGVRLNFRVSIAVFPGLAAAITFPRMLKVADVSSKPPSAASLLFSELKSPALRTANANTEATTTKAIRTMAVSRPVMPRLVSEEFFWDLIRSVYSGHLVLLRTTTRPDTPAAESTMYQPVRSVNS